MQIGFSKKLSETLLEDVFDIILKNIQDIFYWSISNCNIVRYLSRKVLRKIWEFDFSLKLERKHIQKLLKKRIEVTKSILDLNNATQ